MGRSLVLELEPVLPVGATLAEADQISPKIRDAAFSAIEQAATVTVRSRVKPGPALATRMTGSRGGEPAGPPPATC